ncbi:YhgE/Pip domain-containing protein [Neobacillus drentensis]|uniref:YhgE/Pip domain-containing protein n=1 Tax=Neobacillus drentensis TaxID=220684 RepID=UPI001F1D20FF|nr:YhgE/Pip domain-containing protein [Neobacillus drentensis]ULT59050.1 YhgE/Pip domain-containing protein [Neobacillus drentensis]
MGKIWSIYRTDWKNISNVPIAILLLGALTILPSAYAWINIKAMWDPYSNTSGIKVAVANEDEGAEIQGKKINVGKEIVQNLKDNKKLGWVFVHYTTAKKGVEKGDYYAYLYIPTDFSKKMTSILEINPKKPQILFGVNEKINAVAPKIASSGASSITNQISQAFVKTVGDAIFSGFYKAGIELEKALPSIHNMEDQIFKLEQALPEIDAMGKKAIELEGKLPEIREKGQKIIELEQRIPEITQAGNSILKVEANLPLVNEASDKILALQDKLTDLNRVNGIITQVEANLSEIETNINQAIERTAQAAAQAETSANTSKLTTLHDDLVNLHTTVMQARVELKQKVSDGEQIINSSANFMKNDLPTIEKRIHQAANFVRNDLPAVISDIRKAANLIRTKLPGLEAAVHKAANLARNDLPGFEAQIRSTADKLRRLKGSVNVNDLIQFLKHDPQAESSFLSSPVLLKTKRIFPIPNYGSAMTPFYTMLALWVGATFLIASLRVDVEDAQKYKSYQVYFGRLLTFLTIGILQAVIVSLGDLYFIHTYAVDKLWFVLLSILIGIVFVIITFTLCSVFGTIGKGLAIILLVLQISSSGATFPVSTTSAFFQKIYPFMPFTYAVSMLRETVGGMVVDVVIKDISYLLLFVAVSFLLAFVLKKPLSQRIEKTAALAKSSKIIQ